MAMNQLIPGFQAVREALVSGRVRIREIWIAQGKKGSRVEEIVRMGGDQGIPVRFKKMADLEKSLPGVNHQGVAVLSERFLYMDLDHIIETASYDMDHALIVAADHITDEGNLGALIRTAAFFGVHGLVLPKDRSAGVTDRVRKRSSGGFVHVPVARVVNLGRALDSLSKKGFWIIGAAEEGPESLYGFDWRRALVLVVGSEDRGLSRSVRKRCDQLIRIPSKGGVGSLNVSVASGIIFSEIARQRRLTG